MQKRLIISALGDDHPGIINEISGEVSKLKCNIEETQVNVFSGEFSILLDISGKNDAIEKLILSLPELEKKLNLSISFKKSETRQGMGNVMPYKVKITSIDDIGLVHDVSNFFANKNKSNYFWTILLILSTLVHLYFTAMLFVIYGFFILQPFLSPKKFIKIMLNYSFTIRILNRIKI